MKTKKSMLAFTLLCLVLFLSNSAPAVLITIDYKIPCDETKKVLTLGELTATADGTSHCMEANFAVASDAQPGKPGSHGIWNCMALHWLQTIWHDDGDPRPTFGGGTTWDPPIIDPPNGGWDPPAQDPPGDDDQPWYWNATEELTENVTGVSYHFSDCPEVLTEPDYLGFSTYLCAVATQTCPAPPPPECLAANEILVLGGFDWSINSFLFCVQDTFSEATAGDLAEVRAALSTAGFSGWSVVGDKPICCIPEPATICLLGLGVVGLLRRRKSA